MYTIDHTLDRIQSVRGKPAVVRKDNEPVLDEREREANGVEDANADEENSVASFFWHRFQNKLARTRWWRRVNVALNSSSTVRSCCS